MAKKWYRSLIEDDGDPRGQVRVGGAYPGEVFLFDYERPGYNVASLLEQGVIVEVDPTKDDLVAVAARRGLGDSSQTKDELKAALDAAGEEN